MSEIHDSPTLPHGPGRQGQTTPLDRGTGRAFAGGQAPPGSGPDEAIPRLGTDPRTRPRSRWTTLPPDVMRGVKNRVESLALAVAALWAITLFMNDVLAPLVGHHHTPDMAWPFPGNIMAVLGLATAAATWIMTRRSTCQGPKLVNTALAFQLVTAAIVAVLINWVPNMGTVRVSWLCIVILVQPALVPTPPLKTLIVSLIIATMDPVMVWIASMRHVPMMHDPFMVIWYFVPNYVCVGLAVLSSTLITGLGRRVNEARELGAYELVERIGRGGMGEVFKARHRLLARPAAIKLIRPETLGADGEASRVMVQRFQREAQAAACLQSPHTINLYDFGVTDEGTFYYVMELLDGFDLESLVRRFGPVPPERAVRMIQAACRSLAEAHARGMIHRDVKPSNIFTCRLGMNVDFVKVLDFGLVKVPRDFGPETAMLSQADITTGTPAFMAPEAALGEKSVDHRVDIYALGCVAYWLVTGKLVFEAETPVQTMLRHIQSEPAPPSSVSELEIPAALDAVILSCLAKRPEGRPSDALALAHALEEIPFRETWTSERAESWWDRHHPAIAPFSELQPPTPAAKMYAAKAVEEVAVSE